MPKKSSAPDFGYTPEQIKEMQNFFKSNDFTANFSLQHEITLTGAKAEVFGKAKYAFTKYWLDNLPGLGKQKGAATTHADGFINMHKMYRFSARSCLKTHRYFSGSVLLKMPLIKPTLYMR